jgi:hypothetical protein
MNNKHQENGAPTGPLIFTLPASSFIVILNFDWLDVRKPAAISAKTANRRVARRGPAAEGREGREQRATA